MSTAMSNNPSNCQRLTFADLVDYAAGELPDVEAATIEEHLFTCPDCGARAAQVDALSGGISQAARGADVSGFVTEEILNRLARDGVRVRTFTLAPGSVVPCAVWDDDDLLVLRLRGDIRGATEVTLSRRVAGAEMGRVTGEVTASAPDEILVADPAAWIRQLPAADVELTLMAREGDGDRLVGTYTLVHGGSLHR